MTSIKKVELHDLGLIDFNDAWIRQELYFKKIIDQKLANRVLGNEKGATDNFLFFCEHPPVFTLGKSGKDEHLLASNELLANRGIKYHKINRGGDITFHGPGQIVAYPLLNLDLFFTDIHKYLRLLEEAVILTLKEFNIIAGRLPGSTGVWIDPEDAVRARKICAMGIKCSRWVTMHGLALNVNTDLSYFDLIVPCGINGKGVTSMEKEIGFKINNNKVKDSLLRHLEELLGFKAV